MQQALLKMIESDTVTIYPDGARTRPHKELIQVDTTNILFILCGAFVGLEKIIKQRMSPGTIGFSGEQTRSINPDSDYNELILELTPEDMIKYGLIDDFVFSLPVVVQAPRRR